MNRPGWTLKRIIISMLLSGVLAGAVFAHQSKTLGPYTVEMGFANEPAVENQMNAVEWLVSAADGSPVEGLERTLKVEVTAGSKSKLMPLHSVEDQPGRYLAEFMPTLPGDYVFHLSGKINDLAVDELYESGPNRFSPVIHASDVQFPVTLAQPDELQSRIGAAQARADQALLVGAGGAIIGVAGLGLGAFACVKRKNRAIPQ